MRFILVRVRFRRDPSTIRAQYERNTSGIDAADTPRPERGLLTARRVLQP